MRIETEPEALAETAAEFVTDDPAFGIWRDREDMADVEAYLRKLRAPRYTPKLQRHMESISQLPKTQQRFVLQMIETVLAQAGRS